jgi:hypothetical protein
MNAAGALAPHGSGFESAHRRTHLGGLVLIDGRIDRCPRVGCCALAWVGIAGWWCADGIGVAEMVVGDERDR